MRIRRAYYYRVVAEIINWTIAFEGMRKEVIDSLPHASQLKIVIHPVLWGLS